MKTQDVQTLTREVDLPPEAVPDGDEDFLRLLGRPSLIRVSGRDRARGRVISTLLHGNEPSGLRAVRSWLATGAVPAVDLLIFIGAVETALENPGFAHRVLPGRQDLNRCWLPPHDGENEALARSVLAEFRKLRPEALIDIHNNTGHNPAYGVACRSGPEELELVSLFGDRHIHTDIWLGSLVEATVADCPSVTIECGRSGDPAADAIALRGFEEFVGREALSGRPARPIAVFDAPIRVTVRDEVELAFGDQPVSGADLTVASDIDRHNFEHRNPGVVIGWVDAKRGLWPIEARGASGEDLSRVMFRVRDGLLETRVEMMPIMMTTNPRNVRADCLFYAVSPRDSD